MAIRVSDYVMAFLAEHGIRHFFAISGAGNIRLIHAIQTQKSLSYVCPHHEQAGVMAAVAYYRTAGRMAVPLVTAGPGATNTLTGVANAFLDSIPVLVLAGQEKAEFMDPRNKLRCKGVQGLDMVSIVKPITKYAACVTEAETIAYHLQRCLYEATSGKPGPVWLEIPQDIQWQKVEPATLKGFDPPATKNKSDTPIESAVDKMFTYLSKAKRPLVWAGHGIRLGRAEELFKQFCDRFNVPCLASWQAADLMPSENPLYVGRAGTYGQRAGNFALQNSDLLICLGTRLAIPQMGYSEAEFAPHAKKIVVEIDEAELTKFKIKPHVPLLADVRAFLQTTLQRAKDKNFSLPKDQFQAWLAQCHTWQKKYPPCLAEFAKLPKGKVHSYYFIDRLSEKLVADDVIVTDMGTSLTCTHATIRLKAGQRLVTSTGLGEMGFGLPGAIGACLGSEGKYEGKRRTVFIGVEGSLQMNIQELQTVIHLRLPLKIFILNNNSYLTIYHTEKALFGEELSACTPATGVTFPDLEKISKAYGFRYFKLNDSTQVASTIDEVLNCNGPVFCDVIMPEDQFLGPKSGLKIAADGTLSSPPLHDLAPFLPPEEVKENMLPPHVISE